MSAATDAAGLLASAAIIGDSYVTGFLSPALQPALGALDATALKFPNYAVAGTSMASGGITGLIPPQLTQALTAHPATKFTIMDGGGNDILICNGTLYPNCDALCSTSGSSQQKVCTDIVAAALDAAKTMMTTAANAGVTDVIYFFYPHVTYRSGGYKEILDYAAPLAQAACDGALSATQGKLNCYFVDLRAPFAAAGGDMNPLNFASDGIHPSDAGQAIIAKEIYKVMQAQCIGQLATDPGACCTP